MMGIMVLTTAAKLTVSRGMNSDIVDLHAWKAHPHEGRHEIKNPQHARPLRARRFAGVCRRRAGVAGSAKGN